MAIQIPIYKPFLGGNEFNYVKDCIDSTWISSKGKYVNLFENRFSSYVGSDFAIGVPNGTIALHLALLGLEIGPGDEVIVPTLTYIASVNSITYTGAKPVFVDSEKSTWQMDPEDVKKKLTSKTKAILCVHLYGHPCEMDLLSEICRERNLFLIEDCAEALGSYYKEKHVGQFGHVSTFSFYGNKTITTGEGGMVVTNDNNLYKKMVSYRGQGLAKDREYWHDVVGYNYRMTNLCAAIGLAQLEQVDGFLKRKKTLTEHYREKLKDTPLTVHAEAKGVIHSYWMVTILLDNEVYRDTLREHLAQNGIETRPMFFPINTMPMYVDDQEFPVANSLAFRGISLPSYPDLNTNQLDFICEKIIQYFEVHKD